jgi:hypothetical protein
MLPNESGSGSSEWNAGKIATAMTLYKQILGPAGHVLSQQSA